jgi:hypothetical protein
MVFSAGIPGTGSRMMSSPCLLTHALNLLEQFPNFYESWLLLLSLPVTLASGTFKPAAH